MAFFSLKDEKVLAETLSVLKYLSDPDTTRCQMFDIPAFLADVVDEFTLPDDSVLDSLTCTE